MESGVIGPKVRNSRFHKEPISLLDISFQILKVKICQNSTGRFQIRK